MTANGFKDATTDANKIRDWWAEHPDANIGMPTGSVSGVVVLDIDPRNGGDESLRALIQQHGQFPDTVEALTGGGGRHLYFRHPGGLVPCRPGFVDGVDLKGDGGYVVVPPSLHPSGKPYAWELSNPQQPAEAPAWLVIRPQPGRPRTGEILAETIQNGQRNTVLTSLAGSMRRRGASYTAIEAALLAQNLKCVPPLLEDEVRQIAGSVARYQPEPSTTTQPDTGPTRLVEAEVRDVDWLWKYRLPRGQVTIIDGDPGESKSVLTMEFAATVSTGRAWPDKSACERGAVLVISAEDDLETTILPRLLAAGGDRSMVLALQTEFSLTEKCLAELEQWATRFALGLVIIDPLSTAIPAGVTGWNDAEMRRTLRPLQDLARRLHLAIVVVRHLNKGTGKAIYRGQGSIGIVAAVRSALLVSKDPEDPGRRILAVEKSNLGPDTLSLAYRLEPVPVEGLREPIVRVVWEGASNQSADSLLASAEERKGDEAEAFLTEVLAGGALRSEEILLLAKERGIGRDRVWKAKKALDVVARKQSYSGHWEWLLPETNHPIPPTLQ